MKVTLVSLLSLSLSLLSLLLCATATPLDDYVNKPDPTYNVVFTGQLVNGSGWTGYVFNMTSQSWLTAADSNRHVWWHDFVLVVPESVDRSKSSGLLWITGGGQHSGPASISPLDEDMIVLSSICVSSRVVGAALFQVPNQPTLFPADPVQKQRSEDAEIAYTWRRFMDDTSNPEWLLRLPMTKAAVRALDTISALAPAYANTTVDSFFVAGASKRGWTTWTTGAVDKRVVGIIPIVLDAVNFHEFMHRHFRAYGGWSFALQDYYAENITKDIDTPQLTALAQIEDPWYYRDRLTMPKLSINAVGDEFQLPDDTRHWALDMPGEMNLLMIQNAEHSLATGVFEAVQGASAFVSAILQGVPRPKYSWSIDDATGNITVTTDVTPKKVSMQYSYTADGVRRDFRWAILENPCPTVSVFGGCLRPLLWFEQQINATAPNTFTAGMPVPATGWGAFFIELVFPNPAGDDFLFTTPVSIVPNTLPFPDCTGEGCRSVLV